MPRTLKVYRTPTGFHDAYVAAPSRAAALRAWGTDRDLFARGAAEEVTDTKLMAVPLAEPGKVIKVMRGSAEEQLAAADTPARELKSSAAAPKRQPLPRPERDELDRAEHALEKAEAERDEDVSTLSARIKALEAERRAAEHRHDGTRAKLEAARDEARADYEAAMDKWRKLAS